MGKINELLKKMLYISIPLLLFIFCFITIDNYIPYVISSSFNILILYYYVIFSYKKEYIKKDVPNAIFAFIMSILFIIGREYLHYNNFLRNLTITNSILCLIQLLVMFIMIYLFICILQNKKIKHSIEKQNCFQKILNQKNYKKLFFIILICWIPYIILSYSNYFSWDAMVQLAQFYHYPTQVTQEVTTLSNPQYITTHHSVIYTYLLGWFSKIINVNIGIYIFNIIQMLFIIYAIVSILFFVNEHLKDNKIISYMCIFICFYPMNPYLFSFILKDNLFFPVIVLFLIELYRFVKHENYNFIKLIVFMIFTMLLKNNMVYVFIVYFIILSIAKCNRNKSILLLGIIILTICLSNITYQSLNITKGSRAEMLSIPFQQMARVIKYHECDFTEDEKEIIDHVISYEDSGKLYNATISDPIKATFNERKPSNKELFEFLQLWLKVLCRHPITCIEATINNQIGNIYPFYELDRYYMTYAYGKINVNNGEYKYNPDWCIDLADLGYKYQNNMINFALKFDKSYIYFTLTPIISIFTIGAVYVLFFVYTFFLSIKKKNKLDILFLLIFVLYMGTVFLGPCGAERHFRYIYPIYGCTPIFYMIISKYRKNFQK